MHCENQNRAGCPVMIYLANLAVWNVKLHNLHWNVVGGSFVQVHEYTEQVYDEVMDQFDAMGEAVRMRGKLPPVRLAEYLEMATLEEVDSAERQASEVVALLKADMEKMNALAQEIRDGADKMGDHLLAAQFEGYLAWYAKQLWFLDAMSKR